MSNSGLFFFAHTLSVQNSRDFRQCRIVGLIFSEILVWQAAKPNAFSSRFSEVDR